MYHHQVPFEGMNPVDAARSAAYERRRPVIAPFVNRSLAAIIRSCWDPNANGRPTFEELIVKLEPLVAEMPGTPEPACCAIS